MSATPPPPADAVGLPENKALASVVSVDALVDASCKLFAPEYSTVFPTTSSSVHAFSAAEKTAFVKHINKVLANVKELNNKLPLNPDTNDIFDAVKDGLLLRYVGWRQWCSMA
jgi:hypothetical protein